ncbi:hypothetical protein Golomagni_06472, partial [Golovinomyces magnicellulatus]
MAKYILTSNLQSQRTRPKPTSGRRLTATGPIKKPKTSRYPSLKGTDPKFRRNHRHALHGSAKALVRKSKLRRGSQIDCDHDETNTNWSIEGG